MIYCLGNTNYDIVFDGDNMISATPGGSKLNTALSLGRMSLPVSFISRVGNDQLGEKVVASLNQNGVDTSYLYLEDKFKTNLALAFLDDNKKASYLHYGNEEAAFETPGIPFTSGDILLFGSVFAIARPTSKVVDGILEQTAGKQILKIYDPNMRKKCRIASGNFAELALERMQQSHIIKLSDEDLESMNLDIDSLRKKLPGRYLIVTQGGKEVLFFSDELNLKVQPQKIYPVSTIGAGDGFNAGLIDALYKNNINTHTLNKMSANDWEAVIRKGNKVAAEVCRRKENYIKAK